MTDHLSRTYGSTGSLTGLTLNDLPNLPGVRRDIASVNPKLYKRFTESRKSANPESRELGMSDSFEEGSFTSLFDDPERLAEFNKSITPFPEKAEAYNDPNGRYSLVSQRNDRLNKSRSLPYMSLEGLPSFVTNDTTVCSYSAYFLEKGDGETVSARKVQMKLFLEDNSIQIIEPKVENSGIFQGKFLKRHQIFKPTTRIPSGNNSGTLMYTISDFYAGAELDIYNRIYTIVDCDLATKMHYTKLGLTFGTPISYPDNVYDPSRRPGLSSSSMRTTKTKARAKLGYFEYDRKVLRFFGVWDSRGMLFGDQLHVRVHYYLADDTMEIIPIPSRNNGRDKLAKFVKKSKILKPLMQTMAPSFSSVSSTSSLVSTSRSMLNQIAAVPPDPSEYYHWKDLKIGEVISVAALDVLLIDADEFTREFYNSKNMTLGMPIVLPEPVYPSVETTIPPYNGFGSKEDSLATCKNTLMPAPTLKDGLKAKIFQGMILRYEATFSNPKEADKSRSFIIQYHLEDDTVQIREPPIRNSGHKGGIFLQRCKLESHDDSKELEPCDLYIGALVKIFSHQFLVHGADAYTLKYMEANHNHWRYSDLSAIVEKVKGKAEVLKRIILTYPSLATRSIDLNEIDIIFKKSGISLVKQEVVTIFRGLDPLHTGSAKMSKLLKFVMDMM